MFVCFPMNSMVALSTVIVSLPEGIVLRGWPSPILVSHGQPLMVMVISAIRPKWLDQTHQGQDSLISVEVAYSKRLVLNNGFNRHFSGGLGACPCLLGKTSGLSSRKPNGSSAFAAQLLCCTVTGNSSRDPYRQNSLDPSLEDIHPKFPFLQQCRIGPFQFASDLSFVELLDPGALIGLTLHKEVLFQLVAPRTRWIGEVAPLVAWLGFQPLRFAGRALVFDRKPAGPACAPSQTCGCLLQAGTIICQAQQIHAAASPDHRPSSRQVELGVCLAFPPQ